MWCEFTIVVIINSAGRVLVPKTWHLPCVTMTVAAVIIFNIVLIPSTPSSKASLGGSSTALVLLGGCLLLLVTLLWQEKWIVHLFVSIACVLEWGFSFYLFLFFVADTIFFPVKSKKKLFFLMLNKIFLTF